MRSLSRSSLPSSSRIHWNSTFLVSSTSMDLRCWKNHSLVMRNCSSIFLTYRSMKRVTTAVRVLLTFLQALQTAFRSSTSFASVLRLCPAVHLYVSTISSSAILCLFHGMASSAVRTMASSKLLPFRGLSRSCFGPLQPPLVECLSKASDTEVGAWFLYRSHPAVASEAVKESY